MSDLKTSVSMISVPSSQNSIIHGILEKPEEAGSIKIYGRVEKDLITLCVEDDGVGIPSEKITKIMTGPPSAELHGYGIRNIIDRIKLNYGNDYGLQYLSTPGRGTIVTITLPAVRRGESIQPN